MRRPRVLLMCIVIAVAWSVQSCGDNATGPNASAADQRLVGTWKLTANNTIGLLLDRLTGFLQNLGTPEEEIDTTVAELTEAIGVERNSYTFADTLILRADGTWADSDQAGGTWSTEGDLLRLQDQATEDGGLTVAFVAQTDSIALSISEMEALRILRNNEEVDESSLSFFDLLFEEDDTFIFEFIRVE